MMLIIKTRKPHKKSGGPLDNKSTERELKNSKATAEKQYKLFALVFIAKYTPNIPKPRPFPVVAKPKLDDFM